MLVESFEPNSRIFKQLLSNIRLNELKNVNAHNVAVGAMEEVLTLNIPMSPSENSGTASLFKNTDIVNPVGQTVNVVKLDNFYNNRTQRISAIKIDVQGFEWNVIKGAEKIIKSDRPVIIFEHEDRYIDNSEQIKTELTNFFTSLDYSIFEIDRYNFRRLRPVEWKVNLNANLIALPIKLDLC